MTDATPFRYSLSVSPFAEQMFDAGISFTDGGRTAGDLRALQELYLAHGATEMYARVATRRSGAVESSAEAGWERGLERAALARELDLPFNPEIGMWESYGDSAAYQQSPDFTDYPELALPRPWLSLTLDEMADAMRRYGAVVARQFLDTGARIEYWNLGNEVENGIAGIAVRPAFPTTRYEAPDGIDPAIGLMSVEQLVGMPEELRLEWFTEHLWPYTGRLFAAIADGIRSVHPEAHFSTHVAGLGAKSPETWTGYWAAMEAQGYLPDAFGTSLYPTGPFPIYPQDADGVVKEAARRLYASYSRPTFVAECGYPSATMCEPYAFNEAVPGYPIDADGQAQYWRDFVTQGTDEGWLLGLRPWAPDFCTPSWGPMSFFELDGTTATAKPVLASIARALEPSA